ncbi:MAG TPA: DUF4974 domain-containing protein [Fulvivirga sp.]|nr:DUF4974 domain-containing protein [Fulvivirga sp.]
MKKEVTKELLERFYAGKCSADEERSVLKWLQEESDEDLLNRLEQDWLQFDENQTKYKGEFQPNFESLQKKISNKGKIVSIRPWMKVAATLLLLATVSTVLFFLHPSDDAYITKHLQKGNPSVFTLNDGTSVTLSAGSSISYPVKFASNRPVYLEGEAYFDINSDKEVTVYAGNVKAIASNSSFNISAFPEDQQVVVSVLEGKAEVTGDNKILPLTKLQMPKTMPLVKLRPAMTIKNNEYFTFNKNDDSLTKGEDFDPKEVSAWKEGIIYFNNADSAKVIKKLERWYGVDIKVNGCLGQQMFSGEFSNKSIDEILMSIKTNHSPQLEFVREGDNVLINGVCL